MSGPGLAPASVAPARVPPARIALIDAGGANLGSVIFALERLGVAPVVVRTPEDLRGATRVILPGVGAAQPAMQRLWDQGLVEPLRALQVPLLGICLGMQLLYESSDEGGVDCLGLLPGRVMRLRAAGGARVPHMGWNSLETVRENALLHGVPTDAQVYFVHGYAAPVTADCMVACTHGQRFAAVAQRGDVVGMQFHPERSSSVGATLLRNFLCLPAMAGLSAGPTPRGRPSTGATAAGATA